MTPGSRERDEFKSRGSDPKMGALFFCDKQIRDSRGARFDKGLSAKTKRNIDHFMMTNSAIDLRWSATQFIAKHGKCVTSALSPTNASIELMLLHQIVCVMLNSSEICTRHSMFGRIGIFTMRRCHIDDDRGHMTTFTLC
ncbi:hypothetical protein EVAR_103896_1 [Eumeta japonica]|uniref:Uncharacterized protein n=1 Tax=Eumeta variegata TaxID=151549 RepID=A0A4C1ZIJ6_EUMVA|nr:hypothetical protein EVAR_103896_1 [Eumeta japonica]